MLFRKVGRLGYVLGKIRDWDEDYPNLSSCLNKFYCDLIQRWIGVGYFMKLKDISSF